MEIEANCIGHYLMEDATAEKGGDLTDSGVDFTKDGKFLKGGYSNNTANRLTELDTNTLRPFNPNRFAVGMWIRPVGFSIVNGDVDDAQFHTIWDWYKSNTDWLGFTFFHAFNTTLARIAIGGALTTFNMGVMPNFDLADGNLGHLLFVFDRGGIGGGANTLRLYFTPDGGATTLIYSSNVAIANQANTGGLIYFTASTNPGEPWAFFGVQDNIKISDDNGDGNMTEAFVTDTLGNINNQFWPVSGYPIANKYNFQRLNQIH